MGKLIMGFIAGYVLSDVLSQKFPQAQRFKIQSTPQGYTTGAALTQAAPGSCPMVNLSIPMATS